MGDLVTNLKLQRTTQNVATELSILLSSQVREQVVFGIGGKGD